MVGGLRLVTRREGSTQGPQGDTVEKGTPGNPANMLATSKLHQYYKKNQNHHQLIHLTMKRTTVKPLKPPMKKNVRLLASV